MPSVVNPNCPCCIRAKYGFVWHCEDCWNKYHNGLKDKDWLNKEEFYKKENLEG